MPGLEYREQMSSQERDKINEGANLLYETILHNIEKAKDLAQSGRENAAKAVISETKKLKRSLDAFNLIIDQYNRLEHNVENFVRLKRSHPTRDRGGSNLLNIVQMGSNGEL